MEQMVLPYITNEALGRLSHTQLLPKTKHFLRQRTSEFKIEAI